MTPQYLGNKDLLGRRLTAFLASRTVQTARVLACYDWATSLNAETDCVVSGFQSPIERDVLHFLILDSIYEHAKGQPWQLLTPRIGEPIRLNEQQMFDKWW